MAQGQTAFPACVRPQLPSPHHKGTKDLSLRYPSSPAQGRAVSSCGAWPMELPTRGSVPFLRVIHEEEIEQTKSSLREPRELVLEVVVGLFPQAVLAGQRQLGEAL